MRRPAFIPLLCATALLLASCDQRPIDLAPQSTGMEWDAVARFNDRDGGEAHIWADGPDEIWFLSSYGSDLQHFDGSTWTQIPYPGKNSYYIREIWGSGPSDVYLADGELWHYDGTWSNTGIPGIILTGSTSTNVLAGDPNVILRFNGADWDTLLTSDPPGVGRVSAYGAAGAFFALRDSVLRWDGTVFEAWRTPGSIYQLLAFDSNSAVAMGYEIPSYSQPAIWRFDGSTWGLLTRLPDGVNYLYDIDLWGTSPSNLWLAQWEGLSHFNGIAWEEVEVPTHTQLGSLWGTGPDDVYAGSAGGAVIRIQAGTASTLRSATPGDANVLCAFSPSAFTIGADRGSVYQFTAGEWQETVLPGDNSPVTALAGSSLDLYAGTSAGRIYHFDGSDWTLFADSLTAGNSGIYDLSASEDGSLYAAGYRTISRFDGTGWDVHTDQPGNFRAVWGYSRDNAFAITYDAVFHWDGNAWRQIRGRGRGLYTAIWGTSPSDVYLGDNYWIYHYDGKTWSSSFPGSVDFIAGTGPADVVMISGFGHAHFDGVLWQWDGCRSCGDPLDLAVSESGDMLRLTRIYTSSASYHFQVSRRVR